VDRLWLLIASVPIRALRGEDVTDRLAEMTQILSAHDDVQARSNLAGAEALAALARGDLPGARQHWHRAGAENSGILPVTLAHAARAALWAGDAGAAREDLATLEATMIHGPFVDTARRAVQAGVAALEGRASDALPLFREAMLAWRDLRLAWDEALCGLDMAILLDPSEPDVLAAATSAREILVRLGAAPFIARLDAAMAGHQDVPLAATLGDRPSLHPEGAGAVRDSAAP
jgi:hypothetical protein